MRGIATVATLSIVYLLSSISIAQECDDVRSGSIAAAVVYLNSSVEAAMPLACVEDAVLRIGGASAAEAVPLLLQYLSLKRPLNEGERHGIFLHGRTPATLYPAIQALYTIGPLAESSLIGFISHEKEENVVERSNALYALLLIHHGNTLSVITNLIRASKLTLDAADSSRLRAAAKEASSKWCDERAKDKCKHAMR